MEENQFVVDLGDLPLSDDQRKKMNSAIQKAVSGELANIELESEVVLIPVNKWSPAKGGIINGIIIRDFESARINELVTRNVQRFENEH